jgi:hypothetical protein
MENREQYFKVVRRCGFAMVLGLIAIPLYLGRGLIADQFATSYSLTIGLWMQDRADRPRLEHALASLTVPDDVNASYAFDRNDWPKSQIELSAPTHEKAVATARVLADAVAREYDSAGETKLNISVPRRAYPDDNPTSTAVRTTLAIGGPLLELLAVGLFTVTWLQGRANGAVTAYKGTGWVLALLWGVPLAVIFTGPVFLVLFAMAIPIAIAVLIVLNVQAVRRASHWPSVQGRIVSATVRRKRTQRGGDPTKIGNVPDVTYVYTVDGVEHRGTRISIADIQADSLEVQAALERYQVGRTGPVFYDPDRPGVAVLERNPPARPMVMYSAAAGVVVVGAVVVFGFTRAVEIIAWLQPYFPPGAVVQGFLFFLLCGLIASLIVISDLASTRAAARWPSVPGTVLSSRAESRRVLTHDNAGSGGGRGTTVTVWSPLVEYSYKIGERSYHGSRIAFGPEVSGGKDQADATVARYPQGATVTVHYDPSNPSHATLETKLAHRWFALLVPLAFFVIALFFSGRLHF